MTTQTTLSISTLSADGRSTAIQDLRSNLRRMEQGLRLNVREKSAVSTGVPALDSILPDQGLLRGTLSEWIAAEPGSGAASLALRVAGQAQREGPVIIVDGERHFYAAAFPTAAFPTAGVLLEKTILVRPQSRADELWAVEQSLRCPGVGAVLCRIDRLRTQEFRRLQLAAESGTAIGLLLRTVATQKDSGWADVRLLVSPRLIPSRSSSPRASPHSFCRRVEVRCVYAKGNLSDQTVELDLCDETGAVCLAAELSDSATALRAAGD
jgi:hypothetical protein